MPNTSKSVFISYRRAAAAFIARAVFMDLRAHGYDVFMDVESLDNGTFDTALLDQIASRAHFIVILAPGTLERCVDEQDWVRREIEHAINTQRNIVPLMVNNFTFEGAEEYLVGNLKTLRRYTGVSVPIDFFDEAMTRLRKRFLKAAVPPNPILPSTIPASEQKTVLEQMANIANQPAPTTEELTAEYYFGLGYGLQEKGDLEAAITQYNEAIRINSRYRRAYYNRGLAYQSLRDLTNAEHDYVKALEIEPDNAKVHHNLGLIWYEQKRYTEAIDALNRAIELNPDYAIAYLNRARARKAQNEPAAAEADTVMYSQLEKKYSEKGNSPVSRSLQSIFPSHSDEIFIPDGATRPLDEEPLPYNTDVRGSSIVGMQSDTGLVRPRNQDACGAFVFNSYAEKLIPDFGCFIICDGTGNDYQGQQAASLVVSEVTSHLLRSVYLPLVKQKPLSDNSISINELIGDAMNNANQLLLKNVWQGSVSATVALQIRDLIHIGHVGNTRTYIVSKAGIEHLTRDHSLVQRLIELGEITPEEAREHPQRYTMYRGLGLTDTLEVDTITRRLKPDAKLVLCSDGLWSQVTDNEIQRAVLENSPQEAVSRLIALANARGGPDNITVIII